MQGKIQVELLDWLGDDRSIATAAWTSSTTKLGKDRRSEEDVIRVVNSLADDGHSVPFESVELVFWIRMPIFTDRQHVTHRIGSHNGMSGRYRTMPDDNIEMPDDVVSILQNCMNLADHDVRETYGSILTFLHKEYRLGLESLKLAETEGKITNLEYKRAREFLRGILPQASMTERTTKMNLLSWSNYIRQRLSSHAQPEIREVARQMFLLVRDERICPEALDALARNGWTLAKPNHEWGNFV